MTTLAEARPAPDTSPGTGRLATTSLMAATRAAFWGLLLRDVAVLDRRLHVFLVRTIVQPVLLVFVFANVFPEISQGVGGGMGQSSFSTILVPGVVALAVVINGVQAVAVFLVQEISFEREIEDRVLAPIPVSMVAVEKILYGALEGLFAAIVVFPVAAVIPSTPVYIQIRWGVLLTLLPLACMAAASLGLVIGTVLEPRSVTLMFNIVLLPLTMLGGLYYTWASLDHIPWLQVLVLFNPLVYMSEGFRGAMVNHVTHMHLLWVYLALSAMTVGLSTLGVRGFRRRVLS